MVVADADAAARCAALVGVGVVIDLFPRISAGPLLLSADECRAHCRVDDPAEDAQLLMYAAAAQAHVEQRCSRPLTERVLTARAAGWGDCRIWAAPVAAVQIDYTDADGNPQTLAGGYAIGDIAGVPVVSFDAGFTGPALAANSDVVLTITAGYAAGDCPDDLRVAVLLGLGHFYRNREAVGDVRLVEPEAVAMLTELHRLMQI